VAVSGAIESVKLPNIIGNDHDSVKPAVLDKMPPVDNSIVNHVDTNNGNTNIYITLRDIVNIFDNPVSEGKIVERLHQHICDKFEM
jgi:hypothetical protein